ncbi:MAG: hypothetical protein K9N51_01560 [Candidatus Pacebacteria bacterium]|nr:hypothetical protein [Candidatus Paceibacterota bacterium]
MISDNDQRQRRCPRLGHEVTFQYCRTQEGETICPNIFNCWWEHFDVVGFLQKNLPPEEFEALTQHRPKKPKLSSVLELVEQARKRLDEKV